MSRYILGIDLGTVNSCVAVMKDGKPVVLGEGNDNRIPSCLAITKGKELVGRAARRHALVDPIAVVSAVKRLIGHPFDSPEVRSALERSACQIRPSPLGDVLLTVGGVELNPIQVSARILQRVKEVAEGALGTAVDSAVISVPAHFNDVQRKATKLAAEYAGLQVLRLINEPTAAAFAYGYRKGSNFSLAVYDLGGGTFDITIMTARGDCFEVRATDGDSYLGGEDLDHAVEQWLIDEFQAEFNHDLSNDLGARAQMRDAAEKAKVELSQVEQSRIDLPFVAQLADGSRPAFSRTLSRIKLEELVEPLIQRTIDLCRRCMDSAGIPRAAIDEVLLVGGQSRMPAVRRAVSLFFGREPRRDINPDEVVAMGAALYAYSLSADRLTEEETSAAEEEFAVAVKQTAVATKLLGDVRLKLEQAQPADAGLRARLSSLLGDLNSAAKEVPSLPSLRDAASRTARGGDDPLAAKRRKQADDATPREIARARTAAKPAAAAPAKKSPAAAPTGKSPAAAPAAKSEWEQREFELDESSDPVTGSDGDWEFEDSRPAGKPAPAQSRLRGDEKPAADPRFVGAQTGVGPGAPPADLLPEDLSKIQKRLTGLGSIAQNVLNELASEMADSALDEESAQLAREAAQLSSQLSQTVAAAQEASDAAKVHMDSAQQHASARRVELLDVTSHALGIGSAGDLMTVLIEHNTTVPVERQRIFTTNQDFQNEVEIRVYQGRDRRASGNQLLGSFVLEGIPDARRMEPEIAVSFRIDENGILAVSAVDRATGASQSIRIEDPLGLQQNKSAKT